MTYISNHTITNEQQTASCFPIYLLSESNINLRARKELETNETMAALATSFMGMEVIKHMGTGFDMSGIVAALSSGAAGFGEAFGDILAGVAPTVLAIAAGVVGVRLVISLFRQAT